eukprot:TRINITY_DN67314_c5_g14_i1.p1 TRINITY_DN67314_c5_g14~~TRINITY_DN67314_c5_g14_i1.p1  ORF type:complete len:451 (+),score=36.59 TRINITY_DN67314_c5_g14_i1:104-1456(+)
MNQNPHKNPLAKDALAENHNNPLKPPRPNQHTGSDNSVQSGGFVEAPPNAVSTPVVRVVVVVVVALVVCVVVKFIVKAIGSIKHAAPPTGQLQLAVFVVLSYAIPVSVGYGWKKLIQWANDSSRATLHGLRLVRDEVVVHPGPVAVAPGPAPVAPVPAAVASGPLSGAVLGQALCRRSMPRVTVLYTWENGKLNETDYVQFTVDVFGSCRLWPPSNNSLRCPQWRIHLTNAPGAWLVFPAFTAEILPLLRAAGLNLDGTIPLECQQARKRLKQLDFSIPGTTTKRIEGKTYISMDYTKLYAQATFEWAKLNTFNLQHDQLEDGIDFCRSDPTYSAPPRNRGRLKQIFASLVMFMWELFDRSNFYYTWTETGKTRRCYGLTRKCDASEIGVCQLAGTTVTVLELQCAHPHPLVVSRKFAMDYDNQTETELVCTDRASRQRQRHVRFADEVP